MVTGMRSVWMMAVKGIFKRKTYTIAIFFLTLAAVLSMVTALSTITDTQNIYNQAYAKSSSPDIFYFYTGKNYSGSYVNFFKRRKEVRKITVQTGLSQAATVGSLNGIDLTSVMFFTYSPKENNYSIRTKNANHALKSNEVYAPLLFTSQYHAKIGDSLLVKSSKTTAKYRIAGFFEDPVYGSSFMSSKRILFSKSGFTQVQKLTENKTTIESHILNVYLKAQYLGDRLEKTASAINRAFGKDTLGFSTSKTLFSTAVLIIPRVISVVLLSFAALLLIVAAIVIRHAILSSIEADYVSLGVLKALGFTSRNIIVSIVLQYLIVSLAGTVLGVIGGIFTVPVVSSILMSSTGILETSRMTLFSALGVVCVTLLLIGVLSYLTARKAARISPVMAISFGKAPVHFSSRLNIPFERLNFLPLGLKLSLKQMMTKFRQYATLIVITTIFTFMIVAITTLTGNFSSIQKISKIFGYPLYDIQVSMPNTSSGSLEKLDQILRYTKKTYGTDAIGSLDFVTLRIDGNSINSIAMDTFDGSKDALLEGKLPKYNNEIAITPIVQDTLGKGVGDSVVIECNGVKKKYIITSIIQCISEMGDVVCIPKTAYQRLVPDFKESTKYIALKNDAGLGKIISALKKRYSTSANGISISNDKDSFVSVFTTVQSAMGLASAIVMILTFLLIGCITILLCTITIYREIIETGIFKALGFQSIELRLQFTFRFLLISVIGGVIGIGLSLLFAEKLIRTILFTVGITNMRPAWNLYTIGFPLLFVCGVAAVTAFVCSARINRITPSTLITE
jgi:ABC-type transport system, involved in lipoprotein release, permease component